MDHSQGAIEGRTMALTALAFALMVTVVVAWRIDTAADAVEYSQEYELQVIDEAGSPVIGASVTWREEKWVTNESGRISVTLRAPELLVVQADGMIPDSIVVGTPEESVSVLRLLSRSGPGGERVTMNFAGDFMMGRRYVDPTRPETPLVTDAATAAEVVSDIAPLFELADLSSVNYESVIGDHSPTDAYPAKRFLLQSPPETVSALEALGVDVATLGNNHTNDWFDAGIISTIEALDAAGIAHPGAGLTAPAALQPAIVPAGPLAVGFVSMTTVTGDYVNDHLPAAAAPIPPDLAPSDQWQYQERSFGFGEPGDNNYVPRERRRPGEIWRVFRGLETNLTAPEAAELWQELWQVYPELQDWVARRGHGGAARFSRAAVADAVISAKGSGADIVVVELHGGYQFAEVGSEFFREAARASVDAGADLVVGHHPHIVQGFEFYRGKLIAHSLGNFVFDQDFKVTHPSVVLRTVFEGSELLEATLQPIMVDNYRPVAVGGELADRIVRQVNEASRQNAVSIKLPDLRVGSSRTTGIATTSVVGDGARAQIIAGSTNLQRQIDLEAAIATELRPTLIRTGASTAGLILGRDLFGHGDLEDVQADGTFAGGLGWSLPEGALHADPTSPAGPTTIRLERHSFNATPILARTATRLPVPAHRWFDANGAPADGTATYSVRLWAKRVGSGTPFIRIFSYEFDDTDPTRNPESTALETVDVEMPLADDGQWHEVWVDLPQLPAATNAAMIGVGLGPAESRSGTLWVDGLDVVEWRQADSIPAGSWIPVSYIESPAATTVTLTSAG